MKADMEKPIPPDTELHRKLAHLTTKQRANVLAMILKVLPAHNAEAMAAAEAKRLANEGEIRGQSSAQPVDDRGRDGCNGA